MLGLRLQPSLLMTDKLIHDQGKPSDWGRTSQDYGLYRPGYPESFYKRISALDIAKPGQRVLDLGTGTGNVARALARMGCQVVGIDVSAPQISEARRLAAEEKLDIDFRVLSAEETGLPDHSFDLITAAQSFLYFEVARAIAEVKRLLTRHGRLLTCHLGWLPRQDAIARRTEDLILKHNPSWTAGNLSGEVPPVIEAFRKDFRVKAFFVYEEALSFTRESWRGRIRACRGIGASLTPEQVEIFDREHAELLARTTPEQFRVLHWIDAHIMEPTESI